MLNRHQSKLSLPLLVKKGCFRNRYLFIIYWLQRWYADGGKLKRSKYFRHLQQLKQWKHELKINGEQVQEEKKLIYCKTFLIDIVNMKSIQLILHQSVKLIKFRTQHIIICHSNVPQVPISPHETLLH